MPRNTRYIPILKGRMGEYGALDTLDDGQRARMTPMLEVAPVPWDFPNEQPAKTIEEHVDVVAGQIEQSWGTGAPIFVDLTWIADDATDDGRHPLTRVFDQTREQGVQAIAVTGPERSDAYGTALAGAVAQDGRGVCIRIGRDSLRRLSARLEEMLQQLALEQAQCDLVIDMRDFTDDQLGAMSLAAAAAIEAIPQIDEWRSLTLAGAAFPVNLTGLGFETRIPRADWALWYGLVVDQELELPRAPGFGDYGVTHPDPSMIDPRLMRMSAALRYTCEREWLVLKGKNVRDHGFEQFYDLCAELVNRPEFRGPTFSEGDADIARAARREGTTGSAMTWRRATTSHHLATVQDQLANVFGP